MKLINKEFSIRIYGTIPLLKPLVCDELLPLDMGASTLECEGRNIIVDSFETNFNVTDTEITFDVLLFPDLETFEKDEKLNYNFRVKDLKSKKMTAEFYCADAQLDTDDDGKMDFPNATMSAQVFIEGVLPIEVETVKFEE